MDSSTANVLIAALSLLLGWYVGVRTERSAASQYRLSASAFASDWFRDLRDWASAAVDILSEAAYHAPGHQDTHSINPNTCLRCRHCLSALIDRGRFFIPNYVPEQVGTEKPLAYRGLRHPALDLLVGAEQLLSGVAGTPPGFRSQRAALVAVKREFVSQIQELLDPRSQNKAIASLIKATRGDSADKRTALDRLTDHEHPDFSRQ